MARWRSISNSDSIIDSRNVIARIKVLESEREALVDALADAPDNEEEDEARIELTEWDEGDEAEELKALRALAAQGEESVSDWPNGVTLINDDHFVEYAQQL